MKKSIFFFPLLLCFQFVQSQRIVSDNLIPHIAYLSADAQHGRATGTIDELKVAQYIAGRFEDLGLKPKGSKGYYYDFTYKYNPDPSDTLTKIKSKKGRNVLAYLDNDAPYTIVIGAHHDHLGMGYDHNSLDANPKGKIHNGADDNASGVAGVIELARYLSINGIQEKYNFLFMTFSGEELGLIGSKRWCEKPTIPLDKINYMINLDMIGRFNDTTKKLLVYGLGTSSSWESALAKTNTYFSIKSDSAGIGPSDHTSFYLKDIPVLHFFTGQHGDYHRPTDDEDKLNLKGEARILELIVDLIHELNEQPKLSFYKTKSPEGETKKMSFKVTLGVMPDYTFDGVGMRLDGVTNNKPAEKAGLQRGDIILKMAGQTIKSVQDYMKVLKTLKSGDKVPVHFMRNQTVQTVDINL
ncbi:MAG: M20/M25/M40 family metallo-hydrolase [Chitinophagaceae bacterium]|nr:M20/M25/M40 family metallo-hydrolase [Chitinophagaceae bacterium]